MLRRGKVNKLQDLRFPVAEDYPFLVLICHIWWGSQVKAGQAVDFPEDREALKRRGGRPADPF